MTGGNWYKIDDRVKSLVFESIQTKEMTPDTALKLFKAYMRVDKENLDRFREIQHMICDTCKMFSH